MYKKFALWLEEKNYHRQVRKMLLSRLGLEDDMIKLRQIDPDKLKSALESMSLDESKLNSIMSWLSASPDARLHDLIGQLGDIEVDSSDTELPGQDAQLPQQNIGF